MTPVSQRGEGVGSISRVKVTPSRDRVFSTVRGRTVAGGEGVLGVVVVPHESDNSISARCDLNPRNGTYPFSALGHRSHGGTDMKVTSSVLARSLQFVAQSGPTWDPLAPFRWADQDFVDTPHVGHPDLWMFPPLKHTWTLSSTDHQPTSLS